MINLKQYGYLENGSLPDGLIPGRITEQRRERYSVVTERGEVAATLKGSFRHEAEAREDFPCVGDFVLVQHNESGVSRIARLLPRRTKFSRADFSGHVKQHVKTVLEQLVAANFDYVFILSSLNADFKNSRITRYLTQAAQSGGKPVVILTKADLSPGFEAQLAEVRRAAPEAPVHAISAHSGFGLDKLGEYLQPGKTIVFLGMSGVGKSSLLNTLMDSEVMAVNGVRESDSRGRHTTTRRQLFLLPSGAMVIDTPGMRELGLFDAEDGIRAGFADVEELLPRCRFSDCRHQTEPGCAVLSALSDGSLTRERWARYLSQKDENLFVGDKAGYLAEKRARQKGIATSLKSRKKHGGIKSEPDYRREPSHETFQCKSCGVTVMPEGAGTRHRNHCPQCLCSVHVDNEPGDRSSSCQGLMEPIAAWVRKDGEWALIHRCRVCGELSSNRVAADDNPLLLMSIAVKPLSAPPFPLSMLGGGENKQERGHSL